MGKLAALARIISILFFFLQKSHGVQLVAYFSQNGLHGEFHFHELDDDTIEIRSSLETTLQFPEQVWEWGLYEMPIDYTDINPKRRCHSTRIGARVIDLTDYLDYIQLPGNESTTWTIPASVFGTKSIYGKSLVLHDVYDGHFICATITTAEKNINYLAEARFQSIISGSIYFRWLSTRDAYNRGTLITTHLQHTSNISESKASAFRHPWKIYVTDIFEAIDDRVQFNCDSLQTIYDPQNRGRDLGRSPGDIDLRLGNVKVATVSQLYRSSELFQDNELMFFPNELTGPVRRQLFVVINDHVHTDRFLACAKIRMVEPRAVKAVFNSNGIKGEIELHQPSIFEPTWLNFTVHSTKNELRENTEFVRDLASYSIRQLPPDPVLFGQTSFCDSTGPVYNPSNIDDHNLPPPGYGTQEQYFLGDLTGKLQQRNKNYPHNYLVPSLPSTELSGIYWDVFLPLSGVNSVAHRGISIDRYNRTNPQNITKSIWLCGTTALYHKSTGYQMKMNTAQVFFKYPIVGRILFRQPQGDPYQDTTVIIESLIHADGSSLNTTQNHRWAIHAEPPGKDFYNWTGRCLSTKQVLNPYKILDSNQGPQSCGANNSDCDFGYLTHRLGSLTIAGARKFRSISRLLHTDANIPLSGHNSVIGRSLVIYDDFGPVARGERLACSMIETYLSRGVVASDWHGNGIPISLRGKLEFFQQSEYEIANIDVNLKGLMEVSGYQIHLAPVQSDLEFPCESSTLHGRWNPPFATTLSNRTREIQYELGDLSGRFGSLEHQTDYKASFNDTSISLYGYQTILGRSVVISKRGKNQRWACSTFDRSYNPKESREIRAIASFHNPKGYAYGYVRMKQLVHSSGSKSDTVIEINLRHPGENNRNLTKNHHWKIFVNPVGVDAVVQQTATRCVAGGYVWNPFYTQLADPLNTKLYKEECGADNPLRCYVGDVSFRTGTIDLGGDPKVFYDENFPLEGVQSALGRSIVIFGPKFSNERYACANIQPDHDIIKYAKIQKPPKFTVTQFLDEVRLFLNEPEWMINVDLRKVAVLHNGACIQMLMHFRGPLAHRLEQDFSHLMATGRVESSIPTVSSDPNKKKQFSYRTCRNSNNNNKNGDSRE